MRRIDIGMVKRAVRADRRRAVLETAGRTEEPPSGDTAVLSLVLAVVLACSGFGGIGCRHDTGSDIVPDAKLDLKKPESFRIAQQEDFVLRVLAAGGGPSIALFGIVFNLRGQDCSLLLRRKGRVQKFVVQPGPQGTGFPGGVITVPVVRFCVQPVVTQQERSVVFFVILQYQPFDRRFIRSFRCLRISTSSTILTPKTRLPGRTSSSSLPSRVSSSRFSISIP